MKKIKPKYAPLIVAMLLSLHSLSAIAQDLPTDICRIENGDLVFTIDLRWSNQQKEQLMMQYDLDSTLIAGIYNGVREFEIQGEKWEAIYIDKHHLKLQKPVQTEPGLGQFLVKLLLGETESNFGRPGYVNEPVHFGYNKSADSAVKISHSTQVQFTLSRFPNAKQVYISGSFNNWLTNDLPMQKTDLGWTIELELTPGKYYYKFIVDGQWIADPANKLTEPDGVSGVNSILYVTNHEFKLANYSDAKQVYLAGTFNNWNPTEIKMQKTSLGWNLPVYLNYGIHAYKFIVDGNWITDPANNHRAPNEYNTENSVVKIGDPVSFTLKGNEQAEHVYLAGTFNNWNPSGIPMKKTVEGWTTDYYFAPGNYEYKFIVDGKWIPDPENKSQLGSGEFVNSLFVYKPNHTFVLNDYPDADEVMVTGTFNNWMHHGYKMQKRNSRWELDLFVPKGKILYKFIVDGDWIIDPDNSTYEPNDKGSYNSVLWME